MKFEEEYFSQIYEPGSTIDGDYNAREHAAFIKAKFALLEYDIQSIADFGFGKARLLYELNKYFKPTYIYANDISKLAYENLKKKPWAKSWQIENKAIHQIKPKMESYDFGVCNSVIQYVPEHLVDRSLESMAKTVKFLYLHIPTSRDYQRLKKYIQFEDPYAYSRSKEFYTKAIKRHFHFVSWGIVESRYLMQNSHQVFFDSLYRF